jgi:hypothetical protein
VIGDPVDHMSRERGPSGSLSRRARPLPAASALLALLLCVGVFGGSAAATVAGAGYDASYAGESVFTSAGPGEAGQMSVIFFNSGTQPWAPGVVALLICLADKVTCNVASPNAGYAANWYSPTAYATVGAPVLPGQNGFFVYNFAVPIGTPPGTTVTFNGDVGLATTGALLHPTGYYQQNTVPAATGLSAKASFDADPIAADGVSTSALTVTIVDPSGRPDSAYGAGTITATRSPSSANFCRITDAPGGRMPVIAPDRSAATVVGENAQFTITSTTFPGVCSISVTTADIPAAGVVVTVSTRIVGPPAKLGVSAGAGSSHPASLSGSCTVAGVASRTNDNPSCAVVSVDVQDINGSRVSADSTRVVTATLDPATCSGGARGEANIASSSGGSAATATATVTRGRVTFVLASPSAYAGCLVTFTAPSLASATTTASWTGN